MEYFSLDCHGSQRGNLFKCSFVYSPVVSCVFESQLCGQPPSSRDSQKPTIAGSVETFSAQRTLKQGIILVWHGSLGFPLSQFWILWWKLPLPGPSFSSSTPDPESPLQPPGLTILTGTLALLPLLLCLIVSCFLSFFSSLPASVLLIL